METITIERSIGNTIKPFLSTDIHRPAYNYVKIAKIEDQKNKYILIATNGRSLIKLEAYINQEIDTENFFYDLIPKNRHTYILMPVENGKMPLYPSYEKVILQEPDKTFTLKPFTIKNHSSSHALFTKELSNKIIDMNFATIEEEKNIIFYPIQYDVFKQLPKKIELITLCFVKNEHLHFQFYTKDTLIILLSISKHTHIK